MRSLLALLAFASATCASPDIAQRSAPPAPLAITRATLAKARAGDASGASRSNDADTWLRLGDARMQKARESLDVSYYDRAEAAYARALAIAPDSSEAAVGIAAVHGGRHAFAASVAWALRVLAADPDNAAAHALIGDAAVEVRDFDRARTHYATMLALRPDLSSYSRAAHLLHLTGDLPAASALMQQAIASGGPYAENLAWCRAELAGMHIDSGDLPAAERVVEQALERTPRNAHVLAAAGRLHSARGDAAGAVAAYQQATAIAPLPAAVAALAEIYRQQGDERAARQQDALANAIARLQR